VFPVLSDGSGYVWVGLMVFLVYSIHVLSCGDYELRFRS
jgi:uncharacterized membrane protein (DUF4010 family)